MRFLPISINAGKLQFSTFLRILLFSLVVLITGLALKIDRPGSDLILILNFVFFLLLSFFGNIHHVNRLLTIFNLEEVWFTPLSFLIWAGLGFLLIVLILFKSFLGLFFCITFFAVTTFNFLFSKQWQKNIDRFWHNNDQMVPVLMTLFIGVFYLCMTLVIVPGWRETSIGDGPHGLIVERFNLHMSPDYLIQYQFGNLLTEGIKFWGLAIDSYNTTLADRPPLLAGMSLLFNALIPESHRFYFFMPAAFFAQLSWISFVWLMLRKLQVPIRKSIAVIFFMSLFGYIFCNSVFCWPKLLGGTLIGFAAILAITEPLRNRFILVLISLFSMLGFFVHGGSAVSLLPIGILIIQQISTLDPKRLILPLIIFLLPISIFSTFKKKFEPEAPGLFRFLVLDHEVPSIYKDTKKKLIHAVAESYAGKNFSDLVLVKFRNLSSLLQRPIEETNFSPYSLLQSEGVNWARWTKIWRSLDVDNFFRSLGLLLFGIFGFVTTWKSLSHSSKTLIKKFVFIAATSTVFNLFVTFDPNGIRLTYFSYTGNLLFFALLALGVFSLNKAKVLGLFLIQFLYFFGVWVYSPLFALNALNYSVIGGSVFILSFFFFATRYFNTKVQTIQLRS